MTFITIFTAPKPFTDPHINTIQRNAIQSWLQLDHVEVILIGDEAGMAEVAAEFGIKHLPQVAVNEKGTPLVSSIFELARENSSGPLLCYVNADILFLPHIVERARQTLEQEPEFLLIGQRWDLDITEPLDFSADWGEQLKARAMTEGKLHPPAGSDYFIFPRELYTDIPDFAIGRAGWDNWMIYHAVHQDWPAVDATQSIMIVHQNHDYKHLKGAQPHYKQEETFVNAELGGGMKNMYMLLDANEVLFNGKVRLSDFRLVRTVRKWEREIQPEDDATGTIINLRWRITRRLRKLRRKLIGEAK